MADGVDSANEGFLIREQWVNTAVNFLLNPDVLRKEKNSKIEFLKKKGLTEAEIAAAFDKVRFDHRYADPGAASDHIRPRPHPVPPLQPYSFWSRLSGISSSLIVFGVAIYGLHYFFKRFIRPWLLGEEPEDSLTENIISLTESVSMLTESVEKLREIVVKQNDEIEKLIQIEDCGYAPMPVILEELKREVSSLKSILISRHQFPAMPQLQTSKASIPTWQLPTCSNQLICQELDAKDLDVETDKSTNCESHQNSGDKIDPALTNNFYFKHQTYETPESSFGTPESSSGPQGAADQCTSVETSSWNRNEMSLPVNTPFRFGQSYSAAKPVEVSSSDAEKTLAIIDESEA